jgi:streptogramin lyase
MLLWVRAQKSTGASVAHGIVKRALVVGLACAALMVWSFIHPTNSNSQDSPSGQFGTIHPTVTGLHPIAIAVDALRSVYVLGLSTHARIVKMSPSGMTLSAIPVKGSAFPITSGVQFVIAAGGQPYVAELALPSVVARVPFSGRPGSSWTASTPDSIIEEVFDSALAIDRRGVIYLGGHRSLDHGVQHPIVQEYTPSGKLVRFWQGTVNDATDAGMAVDRSGNVYVGDQAGNRLQSFTASGKLRWTWTRTTNYSGLGVSEPPGVAVDRAGNAYVVGSATYLVEKISPSGRRLSAWPVPGDIRSFAMPTGIAVDRQGSVYVVSTARRIFKYSSSGKPLAIWK